VRAAVWNEPPVLHVLLFGAVAACWRIHQTERFEKQLQQ
jgi:hypothetical protein